MKARLVTLFALVAALVAIVSAPAQASPVTDAQLTCTELVGFRFELPASSTPRQSQFYFRVDGGGWYTTNWYYTSGLTWMMYRRGIGWQSIGPGGGSLPIYHFEDSARHTIEGWEYRYAYGHYTWHNLGSCQASTFNPGNGGIVFR